MLARSILSRTDCAIRSIRVMPAVAVFCVVAVIVVVGTAAGSATQPLDVSVEGVEGNHVPPVDAPIIDPFRNPESPWLAGNRGIEYDTTPGQLIRASAPGVVVFAGQVGGLLHVSVQHDATLRTTMAFVAEIRVAVGDHVDTGDVLAVAGDRFHFTARLRGEYIDPELLFAHVSYAVRLIPTEPR